FSAPDFRVYGESAKTFDPELCGTCKRCGERLSLHEKCWDALARDKQGEPYPERYTFSLQYPVCVGTMGRRPMGDAHRPTTLGCITKNSTEKPGERKCRSPHEVAIFLARTGEAMYEV